MSKVVLHIGTHKTATTTIQDTFYENSELLAKAGLIYPRLAGPKITGHHGLVCAWGRLPNMYRLPEGSRMEFLKLAKEYADQDVTLFLSSEEFSRGGNEANVDFDEVRQLLSDFDEIEVVCTLRTQWQFMQSVYQEMSKTTVQPDPVNMVKPGIENGIWNELWLDYNLLLDRLLETFDESEITLLDFSTIRKEPGGVIGAILKRYCPTLSADDLKEVNGGASNVSRDAIATWASSVVSPNFVAPKWLFDIIDAILAERWGKDRKTCVFRRQDFEVLAKHFNASNEKLRKRRAKYQPNFVVTPADVGQVSHFRDELRADFWAGISRRLAARCSQLQMKLAQKEQQPEQKVVDTE